MEKLSLEELRKMCKLNLDIKHVREMLNTSDHSDFQFQSGIVMSREHIFSLYKARLQLAKKNNLDKDFLVDYEQTIHNLQNSLSQNVGITTLNNNFRGFFIFYEPETKRILGVLKSRGVDTTEIDAINTERDVQ